MLGCSVPISSALIAAVHLPATHIGAWFGQGKPHTPQFFTSVLRFASHPFPAFPSQSPVPAPHATPHTPFVHEPLAQSPSPPHALPAAHFAQAPPQSTSLSPP